MPAVSTTKDTPVATPRRTRVKPPDRPPSLPMGSPLNGLNENRPRALFPPIRTILTPVKKRSRPGTFPQPAQLKPLQWRTCARRLPGHCARSRPLTSTATGLVRGPAAPGAGYVRTLRTYLKKKYFSTCTDSKTQAASIDSGQAKTPNGARGEAAGCTAPIQGTRAAESFGRNQAEREGAAGAFNPHAH